MKTFHRAWTVLAAALVIGAAADYLIRSNNWGLNLTAGATLIVGLSLWFLEDPRHEYRRGPWFAALGMGALCALRNNMALHFLNAVVIVGVAVLALMQARRAQITALRVRDLVLGPIFAVGDMVAGEWCLLCDARPTEVRTKNMSKILIGIVLSIPPLIIFTSLFANGDPVFGGQLRFLFDFDIAALVGHAFLIGLFSATAGGVLYTFASSPKGTPDVAATPRIPSIPILIPLCVTMFVWGAFLAVQAESLFRGASWIETTTGLTYAQYARSGFFEIVGASVLILPMLLVAHEVMEEAPRSSTALRSVIGVQLILTGLALTSAAWRLRLYMSAYGLTEDRVYGGAVLTWIALTLIILLFTLARGRAERAISLPINAGIIVLVTLNLMNPGGVIASYNIRHANRVPIDVKHTISLGLDALPTIESSKASISDQDYCAIVRGLTEEKAKDNTDWRGWTWGRKEGVAALERMKPLLKTCPALTGSFPSGEK